MSSHESGIGNHLLTKADGHDLIRSIVLIDRPQITGPVGQFLRSLGWAVYEASNCGQARGLITRYHPEFVVMELLLPLETGFEFCAYVKKSNCRVGVLIFTEIALEEAKNLAMWAGADGFLVKPTRPERLYQQITRAAVQISRKIQATETGMSGTISFRCKCGKPLKVGSKHAGKALICPACQHLAKCPESLLDAGTLFRAMIEERQGIQATQAGIVCPHCQKTVEPAKCRVRDHYECTHCGHRLRISADFLEQWMTMFAEESVEDNTVEFDPLQYVFVQCEECRNLFPYFRTPDETQPCPCCGKQHSLPSIRGVPVSRSALAATGRLFELHMQDGRSRLFLLPSRGKFTLGRDATCAVCLAHPSVLPVHGTLRNTLNGPVLRPHSKEGVVTVNQTRIDGTAVLCPGDQVQIGQMKLLLHGTPERHLRRCLREILTGVSEQQRSSGEMQFSEPGARLLQWHWELQRLKWIRQQKQSIALSMRQLQNQDQLRT